MLPQIDPQSDRPVYKQIADQLRTRIEDGDLEPGAKLPSERELMASSDSARGTIRQAVSLLRAEGLVQVEHGRGAFVREHPPVQRLAHDRFARHHREESGRAAFFAEMDAEGREGEVEMLELGQSTAPPEVADRLALEDEAPVLVRRRRYLADSEPMEIATSYLPWELVKETQICEADTGEGGIYARLEEMGHSLVRFEEEVRARMPTPEEAQTLELPSGVPVFVLIRTAFTADEAVEVCDTLMTADRFVLHYELPAT